MRSLFAMPTRDLKKFGPNWQYEAQARVSQCYGPARVAVVLKGFEWLCPRRRWIAGFVRRRLRLLRCVSSLIRYASGEQVARCADPSRTLERGDERPKTTGACHDIVFPTFIHGVSLMGSRPSPTLSARTLHATSTTSVVSAQDAPNTFRGIERLVLRVDHECRYKLSEVDTLAPRTMIRRPPLVGSPRDRILKRCSEYPTAETAPWVEQPLEPSTVELAQPLCFPFTRRLIRRSGQTVESEASRAGRRVLAG